MCAALWRELGLRDIRLDLNTIGSSAERGRYRAALIEHLEKHAAQLDADATRRMHANPLRVLDSKHPLVREVVASAPSLMDYLGEASLAHFDGLKRCGGGGVATDQPAPGARTGYYNLKVSWCPNGSATGHGGRRRATMPVEQLAASQPGGRLAWASNACSPGQQAKHEAAAAARSLRRPTGRRHG